MAGVEVRRGRCDIRDPKLIAFLDELVAEERTRDPGGRVTRESVARRLLYEAKARRAKRPVRHAAAS